MPPNDVRHAPPRAVLRKTPPQGLRLRRFKRPVAATTIAPARPLALRKPAARA
ncbi:hypothetical protein [Rhizobacter sp. Root1221]|uniref:hypothetical protein n=1 Tax=Rhizobacter sp. Root1221 TaxID=1736433 RepID=UPI0012FB061B|nr:hypothetical protein [Rhizobacter sp. Root1221]